MAALIVRWCGEGCSTIATWQHLRLPRRMSTIPLQTHASAQQLLWLFSRRVDFWLASAGASAAMAVAVVVVHWHGDREIDAIDFVLSELHLGATYHAVIRRRLWHHLPIDVLVVPLVILALTYALSMSGQAVLLTSIAMYAAIWHRGRQSLGVARFYQRAVGGPISPVHDVLVSGRRLSTNARSAALLRSFGPAGIRRTTVFRLEPRGGSCCCRHRCRSRLVDRLLCLGAVAKPR